MLHTTEGHERPDTRRTVLLQLENIQQLAGEVERRASEGRTVLREEAWPAARRKTQNSLSDLVLEAVDMDEAMKGADLVFTGEGRLDHQTAMGKAPVGIAALAKKHGAAVIAFAGSVADGAEACNEKGIDAYFPILRQVVTLEEAMEPQRARQNMAKTAEQVMRLVKAVKN